MTLWHRQSVWLIVLLGSRQALDLGSDGGFQVAVQEIAHPKLNVWHNWQARKFVHLPKCALSRNFDQNQSGNVGWQSGAKS